MSVCQKERHSIIIRTVINDRVLLGHFPEHPLDKDSDLGHVLVVSSLCRGEVHSSSEAAIHVTRDWIRSIAVDLALNVVPLLHLRKPAVQVALGQEVRVVASAGLHVYVPDDPFRENHRLPRQSMYLHKCPFCNLSLIHI